MWKTCLRNACWANWQQTEKILNGLRYYRGKIVLDTNSGLIKTIIQEMHAVSHEGVDKTLYRSKHVFEWKGMVWSVKEFIRNCQICQQNKTPTAASNGLLYPLPIPDQVWEDIFMNFVEGLPRSNGKTILFLVVDMLTKFAHLILLGHPYSCQSSC